jgi:hypothetical protein
MPNDLLKATAGTLDVGVDEYSPDLSPEVNLDMDSENLTSGIYRGIGPRLGMSTIPGHADNEPLGASAGNNVRQSEETDTGAITRFRSLWARRKIFNIFPLKIGSYNDILTDQTVYAWLVSSQERSLTGNYLNSSFSNLSLILNSSYVSTSPTAPNVPLWPYTGTITDGFHTPQGFGNSRITPTTEASNFYWWNPINLFVSTTGIAAQDAKANSANKLLLIPETTNYVCAINISFSGRKIPCEWLIGETANTTIDATTFPKINFWKIPTEDPIALYQFRYSNACVSSSFLKRNFSISSRNISVYAIGSQTYLNPTEFVASWNLKVQNVDQVYKSIFNYIDTTGTQVHFDAQGNAVTSSVTYGPIGAYNTIKLALLYDPENFTESSFRAVLAAPKKAVGWIIQDWLRSPGGTLPQVVDFANHTFTVKALNGSAGTPYLENGIPVASCFNNFPPFVDGTPLAAAAGVSLTTTAGSGIFRANTTYELAYSYYNKRLDFETNVGSPVKFNTGATDFVALQLTNTTGGTRLGQPRFTQSENMGLLPWDFGVYPSQNNANFSMLEINMTEIRFYYRALGSFEWLPLYFVDAAQWWYYPFFINPTVAGTGLVVGQNPIAGLPGGQPGGFVDHSRLPDQQYNCVLSFQDRVWWFSKDAAFFSPRNNMFEYPVKNSISCRTGNFLGGMVHNYPGQAQQSSRLLIFGTKEVYVARFTGNLTTAPVQVSETSIGEYPVDASDLVIDTWTTNTAFSFRSAVVAEGFAYWWGPSGVYKDNGVDTPTKISLRLEPKINDLYDPSDVENIHCYYDATAKEITWYYKPKYIADPANDRITEALTWNIIDEEWLPQSFNGIVDSIFPVKIETGIGNAGPRSVAVLRDKRTDIVSRPYFFDAINHGCGDIYPKKDFVVKSISTPSTGIRRLTLAAGYDATNFLQIQANDLLALRNVGLYAPTLLVSDMLARIVSVNAGSGYIDIRVPTGALIDSAATLTQPTYFPIYHKAASGVGLNGFVWRLKTKYWLPFGVNTFLNFLWLYMLHKIDLVKSDNAETYSIGYRTPTSGDFIYDTVTYKNNSDGNWQLYHALRTALTNNQGQAIKLDLTGIQIASNIVIQFMEMHCTEQTGNDLKQFEG